MKNRNFIFTTILLTLGCFAVRPAPNAFGVSPVPDGGYPGGNTAEGQSALLSLTTGGYNTAVGYLSLRSDTTGGFNTAIGAGALVATTADENTATGAGALFSDTSGFGNTANGAFALFSNTTGYANTSMGVTTLFSNNGGFQNTAIGTSVLYHNTAGAGNMAAGNDALFANTTGSGNTAIGVSALAGNAGGNSNTANGESALFSNTGSNNTALGASAGYDLTTGDNNIDIGYNVLGVAGESNTIRIGNTDITDTFIRGISGATSSAGAAVFVNGNGKLGTMTSSERFKDEIKSMDKASEAILALRPVSFRYKKEIDPRGIPQFGLVAEEVEKVNPDLVIRDSEGKPQTVRYEQINAMLLNEFLKEHKKVEAQEATITQVNSNAARQEATIGRLEKQIETLTAGLRKVSAQLELSRSAPQVTLNGR